MKPLIIIGSAPCTVDDLVGARCLCPSGCNVPLHAAADYMLVGLDSVDKYLGRVEYLSTYHPEDIPDCLKRRSLAGGNVDFRVISHVEKAGVGIVHPHQPPSGSSALLGVLAAVKIGYRRIILAGCPLEDEKYLEFRPGWQAHLDKYVGRVRSLSGWTKEFLGYPTEEWLDVFGN